MIMRFLNFLGYFCLPALVKMWLRSLQFETANYFGNQKTVYCFWHGDMMAVVGFFYRCGKLPITALVSPSEDGKLLANTLQSLGFDVAFGSSSGRGFEGAFKAVRALEAGQCVLITPDGPRGPAKVMKDGGITLAQHSGSSVIAVTVKYTRCWKLNSWDKGMLPIPFTKCDLSFSNPVSISKNAAEYEKKEIKSTLDNFLNGVEARHSVETSAH